jgi:hypothetical protein
MGESESWYRIRWQTLRSGRVARVALAYAAARWLLVQVTSTMLVPLGLPDWALRSIIVMVIAGFFVAIAVAWGFDAGKGAQGDFAAAVGDADSGQAIASPAPTQVAPASDPSVAVLAFADMSPGRDGLFLRGRRRNHQCACRRARAARRIPLGSFQFRTAP